MKRLILVGLLLLGGCSFKNSNHDQGRLVIEVADQVNESQVALLASDFKLLANPTTSSDFSCFTVNITGSGIPQNNVIPGCSSFDNMRNRGFGIMTKPFLRGKTLEVDLPAGPNRSIDVYGIYPSTQVPECGGTMGAAAASASGYYVGGVQRDLVEPTSVVVPIDYNSAVPASMQCSGLNSNNTIFAQNLIPSGSGGNGHMIYKYTAGTCTFDLTTLSNVTAPSVAGFSEVSGALYSAIAVDDGTKAFTECDLSVANQNGQVTMIAWDLALVPNAGSYTTANFLWKGAAGHYSGTCNGATTALGVGGGGSPPMRIIQAYKYNNNSSPQWVNIGSTNTVTNVFSYQFNPLNQFVDSNNKVWIRIISDGPNANPYCSSVQTDFIKLGLNP